MRYKIIDWMGRRFFSGHVTFYLPLLGHCVTIFGANAMWFMTEISTRRWGYICFRPPFLMHPKFSWCLYLSPNATPWAATFLIGGHKYSKEERRKAAERRFSLGHNFSTERCEQELKHINGLA